MPKSILVLGATSSLAQKIGLAVCDPGDQVVLAARNEVELEIVAANLSARRNVDVTRTVFDAIQFDRHLDFAEEVVKAIGVPDVVIIATGALGDQVAVRSDARKVLEVVASNYLGAATATAAIIEGMEKKGTGRIIVLSSVAGDRGRASNYVYGSAKAGMNAYLSGLRARLSKSGVRVITVKLGFVDTQMVYGKAGTFLVADPDWIARKIRALVEKPKDVVYLPSFWMFIMLIIRLIPESIFKRLPL